MEQATHSVKSLLWKPQDRSLYTGVPSKCIKCHVIRYHKLGTASSRSPPGERKSQSTSCVFLWDAQNDGWVKRVASEDVMAWSGGSCRRRPAHVQAVLQRVYLMSILGQPKSGGAACRGYAEATLYPQRKMLHTTQGHRRSNEWGGDGRGTWNAGKRRRVSS